MTMSGSWATRQTARGTVAQIAQASFDRRSGFVHAKQRSQKRRPADDPPPAGDHISRRSSCCRQNHGDMSNESAAAPGPAPRGSAQRRTCSGPPRREPSSSPPPDGGRKRSSGRGREVSASLPAWNTAGYDQLGADERRQRRRRWRQHSPGSSEALPGDVPRAGEGVSAVAQRETAAGRRRKRSSPSAMASGAEEEKRDRSSRRRRDELARPGEPFPSPAAGGARRSWKCRQSPVAGVRSLRQNVVYMAQNSLGGHGRPWTRGGSMSADGAASDAGQPQPASAEPRSGTMLSSSSRRRNMRLSCRHLDDGRSVVARWR